MLSRLHRIWSSQRRIIIGAAIVVLLVVGLSSSVHAAADVGGAAGVAKDWIFNNLLSPLVNQLIRLFSLLTAYIVGLMVLIAKQNNFINAEPVALGFPIVRDLANMVFIIALLIIAAGTILRLENYRYNRLLGRLIVMAFLVNLARFITGFFIQTSQIFMLTFVNAFKDIALGNFAYMFGLDKVLTFTRDHVNSNDSGAIFITLVAGLAMMIIAFSVTLALTVILIVRIIALWVLTILSPLAYALRIIPNTEKYASQWWSEFGKYLVTGPVLAFFLWLALALAAATSCGNGAACSSSNNIILQSAANNNQAVQNINTNVTAELGNMGPLRESLVTQIFDPNTFLTFMVSIIFLIMGMQFASKSGTVGAGFAKRIYEGGLGAGAALTGLNAIRDRTIAPVQGWIANRQSARRAAIQERTGTLEAAGDRTRAAVGRSALGQAASRIRGIGAGIERGTERSGAAASAYERERTNRYLQERGVKDWTHQQVEQEMFMSTDPRRRLAMMTEMQSRGRLDLGREDHSRAFGEITTQNRIPEADRRKMRQDILKSAIPTMSEADVRSKRTTARDAEEELLYVQDLERRKALDGADVDDQAIVNNMRTALGALPGRLKEFDDGLKRANPRMAMATAYNNFANGQEDVANMMSDIQQGTFNVTNLRTRDVAGMIVGLRNQGLSTHQARDLIGNSVLDNSRTKEEYGRVTEAMNHDVRHMVNSNMNVSAATGREKRDWLALQGYADEGYRTLANQQAVTQNFVNDNAVRVAQLAREGRISRSTIGNETAMRNMMDNRRIGRTVLNDMATNNPELRDAARDSAARVVYNTNTAVDAGGTPIAVADDSEQGRRENGRREILLDLAQGGTVAHPMSGNDASVLDVAVAGMAMPQQANARNFRRRAISRQLGNWRRLNYKPGVPGAQNISEEARQDLVINAPTNQLNALSDQNPEVARTIAGEKYRDTTTPWATGDVVEGHALNADEADTLNRSSRALERSDRGLI